MYITTTNSTNTLLRELIAKEEWPKNERFLRAGYQTAGRGQTGNGWESERDKNMLCSIPLPPVANPFDINVIVSVALHKFIGGISGAYRGHIGSMSELENSLLTIKWPNDLYYGDRKLAGILIENAIVGNEVKVSIAGIGLNVNQTHWNSEDLNTRAISLKQITGKEYDLDELMQGLITEVHKALKENVWDYYKAHLYRRNGFWPFVERIVSVDPTMNATKQAKNQFLAQIKDILPTGEIILEDQQNQQRKYHFKQIRYVL